MSKSVYGSRYSSSEWVSAERAINTRQPSRQQRADRGRERVGLRDVEGEKDIVGVPNCIK